MSELADQQTSEIDQDGIINVICSEVDQKIDQLEMLKQMSPLLWKTYLRLAVITMPSWRLIWHVAEDPKRIVVRKTTLSSKEQRK